MKLNISISIFGLSALLCAGVQAASYSVVGQTTVAVGNAPTDLELTNTTVQDGPIALNRFTMHRLRRVNSTYRGSVLLMPALGNNFRSYLATETGNQKDSFAANLALQGYEVWGYSPRETGISSGVCGVSLDCSPALGWSLQTIIEDATFIRSQIQALYPGKNPVIGGLSLGSVSAMAVINAHPNDYSGLLAWEGSVATSNPVVQAHNQPFCTQLNGLVSAGVAVDDQSLPFAKLIAFLASVSPNEPFAIPVPGLPPGLTNLQAFVFILTIPNPVAPSPMPNFVSAAGDFMAAQFSFSSTARLAANIAEFNDVTANRVTRDLHCSLAGVEASYINNLHKFKKPVLILGAGLGFGSVMEELPGKVGSNAVTVLSLPNFGHVDHFGSPNHLALLELPVSLWLSIVLK